MVTSVEVSCSLFYFYIKPQLNERVSLDVFSCSLFYFYIKPQHDSGKYPQALRCSLFYFYIKPQRARISVALLPVVPYSISTSNHNNRSTDNFQVQLFLILFLHQTTTTHEGIEALEGCSLFYFYIKPQL